MKELEKRKIVDDVLEFDDDFFGQIYFIVDSKWGWISKRKIHKIYIVVDNDKPISEKDVKLILNTSIFDQVYKGAEVEWDFCFITEKERWEIISDFNARYSNIIDGYSIYLKQCSKRNTIWHGCSDEQLKEKTADVIVNLTKKIFIDHKSLIKYDKYYENGDELIYGDHTTFHIIVEKK